MTWLAILAAVGILIGFNALYVAAEFATVSSRRSRVTQLADEGNHVARWLLPIVTEPQKLDAYVAACQLGITASSLLLGFYGAAQVTPAVSSLLSQFGVGLERIAPGLTAAVVLAFLTGLQVVLGELVPKNVGIRFPEKLAMTTVRPMQWSITLFRPLTWLFNGSALLIMRGLRLTPTTEGLHVHSPAEIIMLVEESTAGGLLDEEERRLLERTLQWRQLTVRQAMIPRTRMLMASVDSDPSDMLALLATSPHSRLPVHDGSRDNVIGVVHMKDLMCMPLLGGSSVRDIMRTPPYVPESALAAAVFAQLQRDRDHVAVVLDEYGGTAGMVAVEDLIETIFGDLRDEFDIEAPPIQLVSDGRVVVRGDTSVADLNDWFNLFLDSTEADTVGGFVLSRVGHVPDAGEEIDIDGLRVRVESMDGRGVATVSVPVTAAQIALWQEQVR